MRIPGFLACLHFSVLLILPGLAAAADRELLEALLENGAITEAQFEKLIDKDELSSNDVLAESTEQPGPGSPQVEATAVSEVQQEAIDAAVAQQMAQAMDDRFPVDVSYGSKGFRFQTRDGKFQTNLQWRAQLRYSNPFDADPRQLPGFEDTPGGSFEMRRLRMKIGGYGFKPWVKYYFEVDLQPARDPDADAISSAARVIDYRVDLAKWEAIGLRVGQWKIDFNRERVDSSGKQQFVERSIVNRIFTVDRQVGVQLKGRLFRESLADLRYWAGVFNGEGLATRNVGGDNMYIGRLQWNFLGRDIGYTQTDVEYSELPIASLAFGGATTIGPCTRWSSSGCGNLDGFARPSQAADDQYKINQYVQETALKYRGFSFQQEYHRKNIDDRVENIKNNLTGGYAQTGYFFHGLFEAFPKPLELAVRYAFVDEPNAVDRTLENNRKEYSAVANWFFSGHRNKLTVDYSYLTIDDGLLNVSDSENRIRFQWDVSF